MKILVVDTETTGLPLKRDASVLQTSLWPSVVQLSFILYDTEQNKSLTCQDHIIKIPDSVTMSKESEKIHGITRSMMLRKGIDIAEALDYFDKAMQDADTVVAHNLSFDKCVLMVEAKRLNRPQYFTNNGRGIKEYCTMKNTRKDCNILATRKDGTTFVKSPKLVELHEYLFNTTPNNLHNAMADILVCLRCYMKKVHDKDILSNAQSSIARLFRLYCT